MKSGRVLASVAPSPGTIFGLPIPLFVTAMVVMVAGMGFSVILPFLPLYANQLGATSTELGWMVTSFAIAGAVSSYFGGHLSDRVGRRTILCVGMVIFAVATLAMAYAHSVNWLILARFVEGVGYGLIQPSGSTIAQDLVTSEKRGTLLGRYSTITLVGTLLGPGVGGVLAQHVGFSGVFLGLSSLSVLLAVVAARLLPETRGKSKKQTHSHGALKLTLTTPLLCAYIGATAIFLNNGLMQISEVMFFNKRFNAPVEQIGLIFSAIAIAATLARLPGGILVDRWGERKSLSSGLIFSGFASAAIVLIPEINVAVLLSALGAFFGVMAFAAIPVLIAEFVPPETRGRANGMLGTLSSGSLILGAPLGSTLFEIDLQYPFFLSGIIFIVSGVVIWFLFLDSKVTRSNS